MRKLILGVTALAAGVALVALSISTAPIEVLAGGGSPTATPDPTPCPTNTPDQSLSAQGNVTCPNPTQPPRSESTDTPEPSATPAATNTSPPAATNTAAPPATPTPSGGAGAGGVAPPDTGSGPTDDGVSLSWMMMVGALLAAAGAGTLVYGARRAR